jgi:RNA polymerase sigma factor (sigma-70 family)
MEASEAVLAPAVSETAERLFRQHSGWIYGYCLRLLRSPQDAEDALQATYLNACRSLNAGVRPEVDSAWLLRITRNICLTRLRSSSRRARYEHVGDFALVEETLPALDRRTEDLVGLADALASLPEQQRQAILLREWQGLTHREVAQKLGLTQAAAETLIFRARRSLAAALENPAKRVRLRSLPAVDLAGLFAAIKGFVAGGAGVKTVAAVIVVAATTAPVVATDPAGFWSDGPERVTAPAAGHASPPVPTSGAEHSGAVARVPDEPAEDPIIGLGRPATDATDRGPADGEVKPPAKAEAQGNGRVLTRAAEPMEAAEPMAPKGDGRALGQATAESAKGNADGVSRRADGQARNVAAGPTGSNGRGTPAGGRPDAAGRTGTPPTQANEQATGKAAKSSKSE